MMMASLTAKKPQNPFYQWFKKSLKKYKPIQENDIVEAVLLKKEPRRVFFAIGNLGTGIVYGIEMQNAKDLLKSLKPGDTVHAKVVCIENDEGYVELSLSEADKQRLWQQAKELQESGEIVKAKIIGSSSGGLIANVLDLKAFLPVSRLSSEHYPVVEQGDRQKIAEALKEFVGQELNVKIIDVNPRSKKLIISERETLMPNLKELLEHYEVGQDVDVMVSGIADFGVFVKFVDNPSIEGLVHVSEVDHRLITNPKESVKLNEVRKAKIIDIRNGKVFLSFKALMEDPWEKAAEYFKDGDEVEGVVYKFNPFGAVIDLPHDLQGIIHVSEFGSVDEMKQRLSLGTTYRFVVKALKPEERRLLLSLATKQ
ncbi:30S ribosomal protein S1 [Candidatus Parcubacteria bacterium]|nr:MAG: 30S ribosomal protein S1 [Candidatus Parcubacteria bacterium]